MGPPAMAVSTLVNQLYNVIWDEAKGSRISQNLFFDALRETLDALIRHKNLPPSRQPGVEYQLNQVLTGENIFKQYFRQHAGTTGSRFQELLTELDLKKHLTDPEDIDFFYKQLLAKLRLKLPDLYQNF
ncbi:MAG: hypothetical protein K6U80_02705 [Firmicutes bacterium]|nr:hypothetical protein [Bacillota bacterium]